MWLGMPVEIWVVLITAAAGIVSKRQFDLKRMAKQLAEKEREKELALKRKEDEQLEVWRAEFRSAILNPLVSIHRQSKIRRLCREAREDHHNMIDSVLILVAVNGDRSPMVTSCIWDDRQEFDGEFEYIEEPVDEQYKNGFMLAFDKGRYHCFTHQIPGTMVADIYEMEGVKQSEWMPIGRRLALRTGQIAYAFSSFRSFNSEEYDQTTRAVIRSINAEMRLLMRDAGYTA